MERKETSRIPSEVERLGSGQRLSPRSVFSAHQPSWRRQGSGEAFGEDLAHTSPSKAFTWCCCPSPVRKPQRPAGSRLQPDSAVPSAAMSLRAREGSCRGGGGDAGGCMVPGSIDRKHFAVEDDNQIRTRKDSCPPRPVMVV